MVDLSGTDNAFKALRRMSGRSEVSGGYRRNMNGVSGQSLPKSGRSKPLAPRSNAMSGSSTFARSVIPAPAKRAVETVVCVP